uniref:Uncharacterized protein n=1 Tax=Medicago truncatula TaxID=3880 RepID=I3T023_MEDTR|nr:unknown [Medicago truncatula]
MLYGSSLGNVSIMIFLHFFSHSSKLKPSYIIKRSLSNLIAGVASRFKISVSTLLYNRSRLLIASFSSSRRARSRRFHMTIKTSSVSSPLSAASSIFSSTSSAALMKLEINFLAFLTSSSGYSFSRMPTSRYSSIFLSSSSSSSLRLRCNSLVFSRCRACHSSS